MIKLLVNAPSGAQELTDVGEGGGYFDVSCVIWDEREDGSLPEITLGGMVREDGNLVFSQSRMDEHSSAVANKLKAEIQLLITQLEFNSLMNRGERETMLRLYEDRAPSIAAERGVTVDEVLASVPAYVKFKALDDQIHELRAQL